MSGVGDAGGTTTWFNTMRASIPLRTLRLLPCRRITAYMKAAERGTTRLLAIPQAKFLRLIGQTFHGLLAE